MDKWIDLHALWQIVALGLVCGAGLPALFAIGLRALNQPGSHAAQPVSADSDQIVGGSSAGIAIAGICFAVVAAAIGWGIYLIVAGT
jgi:hypothetical protein